MNLIAWVLAICAVEAGTPHPKFDRSGMAYGRCQVHAIAAKQVGYKGSVSALSDAELNFDVASAYLAYQVKRYNGDMLKAVSAYNAGKASSKNWGYVNKVLTEVQKNGG